MKTMLITGTTRGIGNRIYKHFNGRYEIITINRREFPGNNLICDLSNLVELSKICEVIKSTRIDVLINNAGGGYPVPFSSLSSDTLLDCTNLNYHAPVLLMQAVLEGMRTRCYGRIINVSSIASKSPRILIPHYGAAKAALELFSKSMAVAYTDYGITINCVCPGGVKTETSMENRRKMAILSNKDTEYYNESIVKGNGLGRLILTKEVVDLIDFFISSKASAISGQTLNICGTKEVHD